MTSRYESNLDRQIREAEERGDFDNLPGAGKPLPDRGEQYDENWWLRGFIEREQLGSVLLPESLKLRKEIEDLPQTLARKTTEPAVRQLVADLNKRILDAQRGRLAGPQVVLETLDAEAVVRRWREIRAARN